MTGRNCLSYSTQLNNIAVPLAMFRRYRGILYVLPYQISSLFKQRIFKIECACGGKCSFFNQVQRQLHNLKRPVENRNLHDQPQLHHDSPRLVTSNGVATLSRSVEILRVSQLSARDRSESRGESWVTDLTAPLATCRVPLSLMQIASLSCRKELDFSMLPSTTPWSLALIVRHVGQPRVRTESADDEETPPLTGHVSQHSQGIETATWPIRYSSSKYQTYLLFI